MRQSVKPNGLRRHSHHMKSLILLNLEDKQVGSVRIEDGKPLFEGRAEGLSLSMEVDVSENPDLWLRCYAARYRGPYVRAMPVWDEDATPSASSA